MSGGHTNPEGLVLVPNLSHVVPGGGHMSLVTDPVPQDGPNSVYVPTTEGHFAALGIPAPTDHWGCQDAETALAPSIGARTAAEVGANHLYQQSVAGWARKFIGFNQTPSGTDSWRTPSDIGIASGKSIVMLNYSAIAKPSAEGLFAQAIGINLTGNALQLRVNTSGHARMFSFGVNGTIAVDHDGIGTVRPFLAVRDGENDATTLHTDLGEVSLTHDESATGANTYTTVCGTAGTSVVCGVRMGGSWMWRGDDADALIAAGLANKTLLEALGWTLPY